MTSLASFKTLERPSKCKFKASSHLSKSQSLEDEDFRFSLKDYDEQARELRFNPAYYALPEQVSNQEMRRTCSEQNRLFQDLF